MKNHLLLFSSIFLAASVYANEDKFDRNFSKLGYKEVDEALAESKQHFKKRLFYLMKFQLPLHIVLLGSLIQKVIGMISWKFDM